MKLLIESLETYGTQLSALGAAVVFIFGAYKYLSERNKSHYWKEYEVYHKVIKELVEPSSPNSEMYIDRQTAAIYELRFYPRYYSHTLRMLKGLKEKWAKVSGLSPRLLKELDLTINYIEKKKRG